jgi:hypothetical protein
MRERTMDHPFRLPGRALFAAALAAGALAIWRELSWGLLPVALVFGWGQMGGQ